MLVAKCCNNKPANHNAKTREEEWQDEQEEVSQDIARSPDLQKLQAINVKQGQGLVFVRVFEHVRNRRHQQCHDPESINDQQNYQQCHNPESINDQQNYQQCYNSQWMTRITRIKRLSITHHTLAVRVIVIGTVTYRLILSG